MVPISLVPSNNSHVITCTNELEILVLKPGNNEKISLTGYMIDIFTREISWQSPKGMARQHYHDMFHNNIEGPPQSNIFKPSKQE